MDVEQWDIYFASLAGWLLHPGYLRPDAQPPTLEEIADICDQMEQLRNARMDSRSNSRFRHTRRHRG